GGGWKEEVGGKKGSGARGKGGTKDKVAVPRTATLLLQRREDRDAYWIFVKAWESTHWKTSPLKPFYGKWRAKFPKRCDAKSRKKEPRSKGDSPWTSYRFLRLSSFSPVECARRHCVFKNKLAATIQLFR